MSEESPTALRDQMIEAALAIVGDTPLAIVGDTPLARACIAQAWRFRNGGNQWASWCSYLSFVRDVIGWKHPSHENYKHYEIASIAGPRYMHEKFCIISDLPTELHGFERNGTIVAHNDDGPSHKWADGWSIWYIDGVAVDEQIVLRPETQTIEQIENEKNEEVKRVRIERFAGKGKNGWARYITESNAECLDQRSNDIDGTSEALVKMKDNSVRILCACRSTGRTYAVGVPAETKTCEEAQLWMSKGSTTLAKEKKINIIGAS